MPPPGEGGDYIIRAARSDDASGLFRVCLETGDSGADATALYSVDPDALGRRWVGPYLEGPELAFAHVLQHAPTGALHGYCLATLDTNDFVRRLRSGYLPTLARNPRFAAPAGPRSTWTPEQHVYAEYHAHPDTPPAVVARYPSHLHIDLVAAAQGRRLGPRLMASLLASLRRSGSAGVHLECSSANARALRFYAKLGFVEAARAFDGDAGRTVVLAPTVLSPTGLSAASLRVDEAAAAASNPMDPGAALVEGFAAPHIVFLGLAFSETLPEE